MKILLKKVYYCSFCSKHSLRNLSKHEEVCTLNLNRKCKLCEMIGEENKLKELVIKYKNCSDMLRNNELEEKQTIEELRKDTGYCPNCILSVQRLCNFFLQTWNYKDELNKWWKEYNESNEGNYPTY